MNIDFMMLDGSSEQCAHVCTENEVFSASFLILAAAVHINKCLQQIKLPIFLRLRLLLSDTIMYKYHGISHIHIHSHEL